MGSDRCVNCNTAKSGCGCACGSDKVIEISAQELQGKIESGNAPLVVNVLDKQQYDACHISGSVSAPLDKLESIAAQWDKNQEIVVYCASYMCSASSAAFKALKKMGFAHVVAYEGGIKEWQEMGLPVEGSCV